MFCSFICAVYNRERFIQEAISSMLTQSFQDFEIIIVNDGSTDNSESIIKRFSDSRIKYFVTSHQGCWSAKNFALSKAMGEFVCFIDSDDFISEDFLKTGLTAIKKEPFFDYYYPTALSIIREDGTKTNDIWRYISYPLSQRSQLIKLFWDHQIGGIPHAASLIRKDVFIKNGLYNDSFFNLSDTEYIIDKALRIRFLLVPELLTYYNRQHTNQTNANELERNRTYSEIIDNIIESYPSEYFLGYEMDKMSEQFYNICIEKYMCLANKTNFKHHYLEKAKKYLKKIRAY